MTNAIKEIYKWQVDAGNASRPYDDFLESSFQIEEALEGFDVSNIVHYSMPRPDLEDPDWVASISNPKDVSRSLLDLVKVYQDPESLEWSIPPLSDVDRLDKACDAIIFAIGSMAKLGLTPQEMNQALLIVNEANKQKLYSKRDSEGKLGKPINFVGPEASLERLLNKKEN